MSKSEAKNPHFGVFGVILALPRSESPHFWTPMAKSTILVKMAKNDTFAQNGHLLPAL